MVQVCRGGGGEEEWKGLEGNGILSLEGSKEGPLWGRLADWTGRSDGGAEGPWCRADHAGRN